MRQTNWFRTMLVALLFGWGATLSLCAQADPYPDHQIRFIVPFPPGGGTDIVARQIAARLGTALGQPVVVDNRPGAATITGTELTVHAPADGYTIMEGSASLAITPATHARLPYDALKDLTPVTQTATQAYLIVVNPSSPFKSIKDLVAYAKAHPGKLSFGSPGAGSGGDLATEQFKLMAGVNMTHVPYRGDGPALTDLMGGHIDLMFSTISPALPFVKAGQLRALAVSTAKRSAQLPNVPTVAEAGVPGYEASSWNGVLAPAGTPKPIVDKLNQEIVKILHAPDMVAWFAKDGAESVGNTPAQFEALIKANTAKWAGVVKQAGIKPE